MSKAYLRFWGVRGSYTAPFASHLGVGGNTSCVEIRVDDHILLCDAGTGIINFGNHMLQQKDIRDLLVILTHYHWDHICGPGQKASDIEEHVSAQMKAPFFPVGTETWLAKIRYVTPPPDHYFAHGPIPIDYDNVHHPGSTYGYRIRAHGKTSS